MSFLFLVLWVVHVSLQWSFSWGAHLGGHFLLVNALVVVFLFLVSIPSSWQ
jgi:hypothetical protein